MTSPTIDIEALKAAITRLESLSAGNKSWAKHAATSQQAHDLRADASAIDIVLSLIARTEAAEGEVERLTSERDANAWFHEFQRKTTELNKAEIRIAELVAQRDGLVEALEFYADESGWNQPPVKTVPHELFGVAYESQSSKIRSDRGRIARAALSTIKAGGGE